MEKPLKTLIKPILGLLDDNKGEGTLALDVSLKCSWTSYILITTARSRVHAMGLIAHIEEFLKGQDVDVLNHRKKAVEGDNWIILDCQDMVINIMMKEAREFYELEALWFDSEKIYPDKEEGGEA